MRYTHNYQQRRNDGSNSAGRTSCGAVKAINAMVNYGRSKLAGYPFDARIEHDGKIWKIFITVEYVPQEPPIQIIPNKEIDGALM